MSEETLAATIKHGPIRLTYGWVGSDGGWRRVKVAAIWHRAGEIRNPLSLIDVSDTYSGNRYVYAMLLSIRARGWGISAAKPLSTITRKNK